jgi:hypothetical protein
MLIYLEGTCNTLCNGLDITIHLENLLNQLMDFIPLTSFMNATLINWNYYQNRPSSDFGLKEGLITYI